MANAIGPDEALAGRDLRRAELRGVDLAGRDLSGATLSGLDLRGLRARGANLGGARLRRCTLAEADLAGARLVDADLTDADLTGANLDGADLSGAQLEGACLAGATLGGARLAQLALRRIDLRRADLHEADLAGSDLSDGELQGADLSRSRLAHADLTFADLAGAVLRGADLTQADLSGANLTRADLREATLHEARVAWALGLSATARRELRERGAHLPASRLGDAWAAASDLTRRHAAPLFLGALVVIGVVAIAIAVRVGHRAAQTQSYALHSPESGVIYEVDCGGPDDLPFRGRYGFIAGRKVAAPPGVAIQRVALAPLAAYLTERSGPEFRYQFRVGRGWYEVQLHFVELKHQHRGDRLFDIRIEGKTVVRDLDILAETYPQTVLVKRYAVWVDDGMLNVQLLRHMGDAKLDFIRVRRMDISSEWVWQRGDP